MNVTNKRPTTCSVAIIQPLHRLLTLLAVCLPCTVVCLVMQDTSTPSAQIVRCENVKTDVPPPFLQLVLLAEVILYGRVVRTYKDTRYATGVYTAQMDVYCVVKGARTDRIVNITEVGYIPERCYGADLVIGSNYVLLASFDGSKYRPFDTEKPGTEATLKEVASTCNIDPKYPYDATQHPGIHRCPTPTPPGKCIDFSHFTTATTSTEPPPTDDDDDIDEYPTDDPIPIVSGEQKPNGGDNNQRPSSSNVPVLLTSLVLLSTLDKVLGPCLGY